MERHAQPYFPVLPLQWPMRSLCPVWQRVPMFPSLWVYLSTSGKHGRHVSMTLMGCSAWDCRTSSNVGVHAGWNTQISRDQDMFQKIHLIKSIIAKGLANQLHQIRHQGGGIGIPKGISPALTTMKHNTPFAKKANKLYSLLFRYAK